MGTLMVTLLLMMRLVTIIMLRVMVVYGDNHSKNYDDDAYDAYGHTDDHTCYDGSKHHYDDDYDDYVQNNGETNDSLGQRFG